MNKFLAVLAVSGVALVAGNVNAEGWDIAKSLDDANSKVQNVNKALTDGQEDAQAKADEKKQAVEDLKSQKDKAKADMKASKDKAKSDYKAQKDKIKSDYKAQKKSWKDSVTVE